MDSEISVSEIGPPAPAKAVALPKLPKTIVLVGLMGAGKTHIGRRLAQRFGIPFVDADEEIEKAAGCTIEEIFEHYDESHFRDGERRVIARLLDQPVHVLATGGGAFMDPRTREKIRARGISVWLRADLELLLRRTSRRNNRPLLKDTDRRATLERLMAARYPVYAAADIVVDSVDGVSDTTVERVIAELGRFLGWERSHKSDSAQQAAR